jgi:hypothetical protein
MLTIRAGHPLDPPHDADVTVGGPDAGSDDPPRDRAARRDDRPDTVPDTVWDHAADHYDDKELSSLLVSVAAINTWNRLNAATRQRVPAST